jgi:type I restriction enzyme S subunit
MRRRLPASSFADWVTRVPTEWDVERLGNVAEILFSNVDKHTIEGELPVRLCNYVDVYKNARITRDIDFMDASATSQESARFQIYRDDVLATKDSETSDDIAISSLVVEDLPNVVCGYHLALIRSRRHRAHGPYLAWLHACKTFRAHYEANAIGVTRFGLSQAAFKEARVPLPSLPEQRRIVAYLDDSCAAIDAAVATKRRQIETLEALRKTIIYRSVTLGLNPEVELKPSGLDWVVSEVPAHWQVKQIKRICSLVRGQFTHRPRNDPALYDGPYPFVQTGDITAAGKYIRTYSQTLNELGLSVSKMFPQGTLVMSIAANIGDVAILDFEACFPDSMIGMIPGPKTCLDYLFYLMRTMKDIMLRSAVLSTQLNLNYVRIGTNFAAIPPRKEQEAIAEYLDTKEQEVLSISAGIESQIETLTAYRKSLIQECVTGQRRITETDLNRVKANG